MEHEIEKLTNAQIMDQIHWIEGELEAVKNRFAAIDMPTFQDYYDRDAQIETLLADRDRLHMQYRKNVEVVG